MNSFAPHLKLKSYDPFDVKSGEEAVAEAEARAKAQIAAQEAQDDMDFFGVPPAKVIQVFHHISRKLRWVVRYPDSPDQKRVVFFSILEINAVSRQVSMFFSVRARLTIVI